MQPRFLTLLFATALVAGCTPAVQVVQPGDAVYGPVTAFSVKFHEYYQPGTFKAYLDGTDITSSFSPAGVSNGTAAAAWNQPYVGGDPAPGGPFIGAPQASYESLGSLPSGTFQHKLRVSGSCKAGTACADNDEQVFNAVSYVASPAPLQLSAGTTIAMQLRTDRNLAAPLAMTVEPRLLGSPSQPAPHVRVNNAPPGAPASVTLPAGTAPATVTVSGLSPGGFYLLLSAPGTQRRSVTGTVK
jgi:hypothetical protein